MREEYKYLTKELLDKIDKEVYKSRQNDGGLNLFHTIDNLPLSEHQKCCVLEWFARKLWKILEESTGDPDYYGKSYDPLRIDGKIAHSYVFNLEDGGRHHKFRNLLYLEEMLEKEAIDRIKELLSEIVLNMPIEELPDDSNM